jgi:hypothetical protein
MIIREWQEEGVQCHMFQIPVYCLICKKWSTIEDGKPGDEAQCANPTCRIKSVIEEARGGQIKGFLILGRRSSLPVLD